MNGTSSCDIVYHRAGGGGRNAPVGMMMLGKYPVLSAPKVREMVKDILANVRSVSILPSNWHPSAAK